MRGDANGRRKLEEAHQKGEDLFTGVAHTREFVLDTEANVVIGKIVSEQALNIDVALSSDSPAEFCIKVKNWLARQEEMSESARWSALAKLAAQDYPVCPGLSCVYGPIPTVPLPRKEVKARPPKDRVAPQEQVKELEEEEDPNAVSQATMRQVDNLDQMLQAAGGFPVWQLVTNPKSMAQTVEHMFHLSFLVKEGKARIENGANGPVVRPAEPPDNESEGVERVQAIVRLDASQLRAAG